tara:strand:+ start:338 stop:538 length:201 start_codon:yes stop_codon:yes gene_type:complete
MILYYLSQIATDITLNLSWWVIKNTTYVFYNGTLYLFYGKQKTIKDLEKEIIELRNEISSIEARKS